VPYSGPRFNENGEQMWKKHTTEKEYWEIDKLDVHILPLIADEGQKVKNVSTGLWSVLFLLNYA